jgi:flagellar biosynthesis chaperone FliJ
MAVIDHDVLGQLLQTTGGTFEIPADGAAEILRRAEAGPVTKAAKSSQAAKHASPGPEQGAFFDVGDQSMTSVQRLRGAVRTHRVLSVAAAVVVVGGITAGTLLSTGNPAPSSRIAAVGSTTGVPHRDEKASAGEGVEPFEAAPVPASAGAGGSASAGTAGSAAQSTGGATATGTPATNGTSSSTALPNDTLNQSAKIEETGSLSLSVARGRLSATMTKLTFLATYYGGFVANSQTQSGTAAGQTSSGTVTLQIPVASFSAAVKQAQSFGETESLSTKATDVTGTYVDLQARISALEASRQQYLTIMAKATTIGDVLSVQAQLDTLQTEIEQLQGQLQLLSSQTTYSTLTVQVSQAGAPHHRVHHPGKPSGLSRAWHDSVHGFVSGVDDVVRLAGPVLFILLCLALGLFGGRLLWRRLQRHNL